LETTYDIAEEQIAQRDLPDEAALTLRMPRARLAAARERYGCVGAVVASDGQHVCPLDGMSMHARTIAAQVLALYADEERDNSSLRLADGESQGRASRRAPGPYL
jgi:hypothetical protein